jgi:uncharacterized protein YdaT
MKTNQIQDIIDHAISKLEDMESFDYASDLHNTLFNEDHFIIGTYKAKEWLGGQVFDAIEKIREYEESNFGEVTTDFSSPESVVNMYVYIMGEEILSHSETLQDNWNNSLNSEDIENIIAEIDAIPLHSI